MATRIWIAVVAALVFALGAWLSLRTTGPTLIAPQQSLTPLLQRIAATASEYTVAIAVSSPAAVRIANDFFARVPDPFRAAGFGVYVSDSYVLTHIDALEGRSSVELSGGTVGSIAHVVAYDSLSGLVLLQTPPAARSPLPLATDPPRVGSLTVGVGRSARGDLAIPIFVTAVSGARYVIGALNGSIPPGMPVFTVDGALFAVAAPDGGEARAIPVREAVDRLIARVVTNDRRSSFGVAFQALSGPVTILFGDEGVVITYVIEGGPADLAGIQVGDVLMSVGDTQIDSLDGAEAALRSAEIGAPTVWTVDRSHRMFQTHVTPASSYEVAALVRPSRIDPWGPLARVVFSPVALEAAGIPHSARVLRLNGRVVSSRAQVERELRLARAPVAVLLRQGDARFFLAVEPTR